MKPLQYALAAALAMGAVTVPVLAHHSFAAEYDREKPVSLKGTVTAVDWVNPHAWIHLDVKDDAGQVTNWSCELGSPNLLLRNGWRRDTLKPGDAIIIEGTSAKDGAKRANARTVKLANGQRVFNAGSSGDPGTPGAPTQ
jgi:Family of unknown function (DUF6152)